MAADVKFIEYVAGLVIAELAQLGYKTGLPEKKIVPIGISARHVHLQPEHLEALFGSGYRLKPIKPLSQPGQFAADETVSIVGPKGRIDKVRILGPERKNTQVEISVSDARKLGVEPIVRNSGDVTGTPGIRLIGSYGSIDIPMGVIVADRHLHLSTAEGIMYGLKNGQKIKVRIPGPKGGIMDNITVRVGPNYSLDLHVDTDDASAFMLRQGDTVDIIKENGDTGI